MATTATTTTEQVDADERLARELQQQEMQQQQVGQPMGGGGQMPVVQGTAVGGYPAMGQPYGQPYGQSYGQPYGMAQGGAPVVIGAPQGAAMGMGLPHIVVEELPLDEIIVLRYRFSLMCFACIDAFSSVLHAGSMITAWRVATTGDAAGEVEDDTERRSVGPVTLGLIGILFLIGPICGMVGARRLQRQLVSVYLGFCIVKTGFEIFLAVLTLHLWFILFALVQLWITRIVFTFWRALGKLSSQRIQELLNPEVAYRGQPVRMAYW